MTDDEIEDQAKAAHAVAEWHRARHLPVPADVQKLERDYYRMVKRWQRRRKIAERAPRVKADEIRDPIKPYRYRAKRYPWAERVLAASEAEHGSPDDEVAA